MKNSASPTDDITGDQDLLLQFVYQCPVGLAEVDDRGAVRLLNALGVALLLPIAGASGLDNFFDLMRPISPELISRIETASADGEICRAWQVRVERSGIPIYLSFTVIRLSSNRLMIAFLDVTASVEAEGVARDALEARALQSGRADMASTVLHDIGNAIVGIGTRSARLLAEPAWVECENLARLSSLLQLKAPAFVTALGERKAAALVGLTSALERSLRQREIDLRKQVLALVASVSHVQDILSVQRQYVNETGHEFRKPVALGKLVEDAIAIQSAGLEKRAIQVIRRIPADLPLLRVDRTRMVQVLGNLIQNTCESFDSAGNGSDLRHLEISAERDSGWVILTLTDNGSGFPPELAETFFERGKTSKDNGGGLGLYSCRSTIESHGGRIDMTSKGINKGATVTIHLLAEQDDERVV